MKKDKLMIANTVILIAGLWLVVSAFLFGLGMADGLFYVGLFVAIFAMVGLFSEESSKWTAWLEGILGLWLLVSPMLSAGMTVSVVWNNIVVGIVIIASAITAGLAAISKTGMGHPRMG